MIKSLCVFCGSSTGRTTLYKEQAYFIGKLLAESDVKLVYGGASIGLMGSLAQGSLDHQGKVIGVIPESLSDREIAHQGLSKLHVVKSMHQRKEKMYQLSEAFLALPGGFGTLDELFEILTWKQLGLHNKAIYVLNTNSFFDPLYNMAQLAKKEGFVSSEHSEFINFISTPEDLEQRLTQ